MRRRLGFSLVETLVVVVILGIIGSTAIPLGSQNLVRWGRRQTAQGLESMIYEAQLRALENKLGSVWGVCQDGNEIRLYSGTCSNSIRKLILPRGVGASGVGISFAQITGDTGTSRVIEVTGGGRERLLVGPKGYAGREN